MRVPPDLPQIALVRVERAGGPYRPNDRLSLAFVVPTVGRVVAHDGDPIGADVSIDDDIVPDTITVVVDVAATPYECGERLTLAFVDPRVARIHPAFERDARAQVDGEASLERAHDVDSVPASASPRHVAPSSIAIDDLSVCVEPHAETARASSIVIVEASLAERPHGVVVRLAWTPERVRRFVRVVDKLFTVDRLGWYRHTLAMRLLVPDDVTCGDDLADIEARRHVHALRAAAVETLGRPLIAAFMPNFSVSTEWLGSLDLVGAARSVVGICEALTPFAAIHGSSITAEAGYTVRTIGRGDLDLARASVEAAIAVLVPTASTDFALTTCLEAYRTTLVDVFGQTARAAEAVRVNGMTQPNHSLDDRLWQLVGAIGEAFGGLAVA